MVNGKQAQEIIKHMESFPELDPNPVLEIDFSGRINYCNSGALKTLKEIGLSGKDIREFIPKDLKRMIKSLRKNKKPISYEVKIANKAFIGNICLSPEFKSVHIYLVDVTERKRTEDALRESEERYKNLVLTFPDAVLVHSSGKIKFINPAGLKLFRATDKDELIGKPILSIVAKEFHGIVKERIRMAEKKQTPLAEIKFLRLDGSIFDGGVTGRAIIYQGVPAIQVVIRDISGRKKAEEDINKLNRTLKALTEANQAFMRATDEPEYLRKVCRIIVKDCGYALVWIGFLRNDKDKRVLPVAQYGFGTRYLNKLNLALDDTVFGCGRAGRAVRTGKPCICRDILTDVNSKPWYKQAAKHGYRSSVVIPLTLNNKTFGAISIYSRESGSFTKNEVRLLIDLADDIAYGITAIRFRFVHQQAKEQLRESEIKFRLAFENAQDAIIWADVKTGILIDCNKATEDLFEKPRAEIIGQHQTMLHPPQAREYCRKMFKKQSPGNAPVSELPIITKSGEIKTVIISASAVEIKGRKILQGVFRDITERKKAQEESLRTQERLRLAQEVALAGTWDWDMLSGKSWWSPEYYLLYGLNHKMVKPSYDNWLKSIYPDDRNSAHKAINDALKKKNDVDITFRILHPEKGLRWINSRGRIFYDKKGNAFRMTGVSIDITERKRIQDDIDWNYKVKGLLNSLIRISTEDISLKKQLKYFLEAILSAHLAPILSKGAIFLIEKEPGVLVLKAEKGLSDTQKASCSRVPFDKCLCGRAAREKKIIFTSSIDHRHDIRYKGISPHGHYIVPLFSKDRTLGVMALYIKEGHQASKEEKDLLEAVSRTLSGIIEQRLAKDELQRQQIEEQIILDSVPALIFYKDKDNNFIRVNKGLADAMGLGKEEMEGKSCFEFWPRKQAKNFWRDDKEVMQSGRPKLGIIEPMMSPKGERWVQTDKIPYRNENGEMIGIIGFALDITERKHAEEALQRAHDELEFKVAQRTTELTEANKHILYRNEILKLIGIKSSRREFLESIVELLKDWSGCRYVGIRVLDAEGRIPYDAYTGFSREFWESENWLSIKEDQCACIRVIQGKPEPQDFPVMTKAGSFYTNNALKFENGLSEHAKTRFRGVCVRSGFKSLAVIPIRNRHETYGAIHFADPREGIVPLNKVEFLESLTSLIGEGIHKFNLEGKIHKDHAILDAFFKHALNPFVFLDPSLNFIRVNEAYARACRREVSEFPGHNHFEFYPHEENERIFREVVRTKVPFQAFAKPFVFPEHPEWGVSYWDWALVPILDNKGNVEFLAFSINDVTERKLTEQKLSMAQKELVTAKRLSDIGVLAATVAHELRNPLGVIRTATYNIKRKAQNPLLDSHLNNIEKKILESDQIINNLLFYSRLKTPHYETVRFYDILNECINSARIRFGGSSIRIIKKISSLGKAFVDADPIQMAELFNNILNNAYDAFMGKHGTIEIRAKKDSKGNLEVVCKDSGVGIDKEHLKNVFEPFFTTKAKGTGLGLTVCNQIVNLHGGKIAIDSEKGKGTTVTVTVPLKRKLNGNENLSG